MSLDKTANISANFNRQTPAEMRVTAAANREKAAVVNTRAYEVGRKVEEHYQKHRDAWIVREVGTLLKDKGSEAHLKPAWAVGEDFVTKATKNVASRHAVRHARVALARTHMLRDIGRSNENER